MSEQGRLFSGPVCGRCGEPIRWVFARPSPGASPVGRWVHDEAAAFAACGASPPNSPPNSEPPAPTVAQAIAQRDDALERVEEGSGDWHDEAIEAGIRAARERPKLTSETLWEYIRKPREPRAIGPVMVSLAKQGIIRKVEGEQEPSRRRHMAPLTVYDSLIYEDERRVEL